MLPSLCPRNGTLADRARGPFSHFGSSISQKRQRRVPGSFHSKCYWGHLHLQMGAQILAEILREQDEVSYDLVHSHSFSTRWLNRGRDGGQMDPLPVLEEGVQEDRQASGLSGDSPGWSTSTAAGWQKRPRLGNGGSGKPTEQARGRKGQQGFRFPSQSEFSGEAEPEGYEAHTHLYTRIGLRG